MMTTIMAFFGYVKVPTEAVWLSINQEVFLEKLTAILIKKNPELELVFSEHVRSQKTITQFLRSGKIISG